VLSPAHANSCQHYVKIYTDCIMSECGCRNGGSRRTRKRTRKRPKRHTRSRKYQRLRGNRRRSKRGGGANTFLPQSLVNTFRNLTNSVQTRIANFTGGPIPISPSVLNQTPIEKPSEHSIIHAIRPIKTPTKKTSPFRK